MANIRPKKQITYFKKNGDPFAWKLNLLNSEYQTTPYSRNDRPNPDMIAYYVDNKWSAYQFDEDTLKLIFAKFNDTNDPKHMYARLLALNSIYSTKLDSNKLRILADVLIEQTTDINLNDYSPDIVDNIRTGFKDEYGYDPYSFVSKYFSHINEDAYPIFDSYVKMMLLWYRHIFEDFDFDIDDIDDYDRFKTILENFISIFDLNCNLRTADKFLWTAGKEFFPQFVYKDLIEKYKP